MSAIHIPTEVEYVAKELSIPIDGLIQRSVRAFLIQEMRAVQFDIADLQDRYHAADVPELREQIKQGEIYSHPAWEDSIEWEQLEIYRSQLKRLLNQVSDV